MQIHFNHYTTKPSVKEKKERGRNLNPAEGDFLSDPVVSSFSKGVEQTEEGFKKIVNTLCETFGAKESYEDILSKCISDAHCKDEKDILRVTLTDDIFSLVVIKNGHWLAKILDYEHYERAMQSIVKGLTVLTKQGFFTRVAGVYGVQDGKTEIYFHVVFVPKGDFYYEAYHSTYNSIDCYAKATGPNGDLFVFKYEMPIFFSSADYFIPKVSPFEDRSFEIKFDDKGKKSVPLMIMKTKELKDNFYVVKVGLSGRTHSTWIAMWNFPLCVVFTAKTLEEALSKLHGVISNRGLVFADYEKLKEAVLNAKVE